MGVPSFFRWLVNKYPNIVVDATEKQKPNAADGLEFDNLYLDLNNILYLCLGSDDHDPPRTFHDVFNYMFKYIDRLFSIVWPRKLLFMAIDGNAPLAKIFSVQQPKGSFHASKDYKFTEAEANRLIREFEMQGKPVLPEQESDAGENRLRTEFEKQGEPEFEKQGEPVLPEEESEVLDSKIINPGTKFMHELSIALQSYIHEKLANDAGWKDIKVILSDANVPGEGEHKIMSFIRLQRTSSHYDPNTRHCVYGPDADLIMLALATHEVHFSILREVPIVQNNRPGSKIAIDTNLNKAKHSWISTREWYKQLQSSEKAALAKKPYEFLHVWILREYLELDMKISDPPINYEFDLERIIDDFIFICLFVGNDFLPHLPTLKIHEGALDLLMHVYKKEFKNFGGYLVDMQWVADKKARYMKLERIEKFILLVGAYEEKIFEKRSKLRERKIKQFLSQFALDQDEEDKDNSCASAIGKALASESLGTESSGKELDNSQQIMQNKKELKKKLKSCIHERTDLFKDGHFTVDKVRLGEAGWKERYYKEKFFVESEDIEKARKAIVKKYTEGLCWVLLYYYSCVPSWTWSYFWYYGPFASDFKGMTHVNLKFERGFLFKPFDQLMTDEEHSNIRDFYVPFFDAEGKRTLWKIICKLPFTEDKRLLSVAKKWEVDLTDCEAMMNTCKVDRLSVRSSNNLASQISLLYQKANSSGRTEMVKEAIEPDSSGEISGFISPWDEILQMVDTVNSSAFGGSFENIVLCVYYELPDGLPHVPRSLEGVHFPEKTICEDDIVETKLWHEQFGKQPRNSSHVAQAKSVPTSSMFGETHKGSGSSRSLSGRGEAHDISGFRSFSNATTEQSNHAVPNSEGNFRSGMTCNLNNESGSGQGIQGIKDLKILDSSSLILKPYGRAQPRDYSFWSTRTRSPTVSAGPSSSVRGGFWQNSSVGSYADHEHRPTASVHGFGRGQHSPKATNMMRNSKDSARAYNNRSH